MNTEQGRGAENGSMFLKQLDNLFGLGPLPKRHGNDGQLGQGEGRRGRRERWGGVGGRWREKVVLVGLCRGGKVVVVVIGG